MNASYIVFAVCAAIAAFGAWLLVCSHGVTEHGWGSVLLVFFGLAAIVLPLLIHGDPRNKNPNSP